MRRIKLGLESVFSFFGRLLSPLFRAFVRFLILPIYRVAVTLRLRIQRMALPARGFVLFLITNRYLLHGVLAVIIGLTVASNLQGRQAHAQDVGQKSLLFALATDEQSEIIEDVANPENLAKNANYLGSATIASVPHIDFDYEDDLEETTSPSVTTPGTIAAQPYEDVTDKPVSPRSKVETYIVKEGDTLGSIAQNFGINIGTVLWNNNLTERQYIRPGDTLRIPPVSGLLVKVKTGDTIAKLAERYDANETEIADFNKIATSNLAVGSEIVVPGGTPPEIEQTRTIVIAQKDPVPPLRNVIPKTTKPSTGAVTVKSNETAITTPSVAVAKPPDLDVKDAVATRLLWPTSGRVITQYYGWKHTGVDIDGDYSSPLYAAGDGVVETAGWNSGGYGLMILIDHPNGMVTRYGHASKLFVKAGDKVKRGQVIAMMGTTGRSTGTHLHYEVYVNGKRVNPLTYTK